ncbi:hypothetical protein CDO52_26825 [Nocardiopsis gilva YIM 90087]|uniref:Uncharacterized protein n=1 Tax=Nocardiopsis gilva YIM 90087 TaxID=1235441 RepID=A0A223SCU9_9ACTN|nr:hypothetical protein [Nocardiopsis gilva]ASU85932.1 hypothetical protein CDO52_26825 [Nocardiopsis gilva YIM 90087]
MDAREELGRRLAAGELSEAAAERALTAVEDVEALLGAEQWGSAPREELLAWIDSWEISDEALADAYRAFSLESSA